MLICLPGLTWNKTLLTHSLSLKLFGLAGVLFVNSHPLTLAIAALIINVHPLGKTANHKSRFSIVFHVQLVPDIGKYQYVLSVSCQGLHLFNDHNNITKILMSISKKIVYFLL